METDNTNKKESSLLKHRQSTLLISDTPPSELLENTTLLHLNDKITIEEEESEANESSSLSDEREGNSAKENLYNTDSIELESSEKIEDIKINLKPSTKKTARPNYLDDPPFGLSSNSRNIMEKRKRLSFEQASKQSTESRRSTKKTKISPFTVHRDQSSAEKIKIEALGASVGYDQNFSNKENISGAKKISDFFKPKETVSPPKSSGTRSRGKGLTDKKQEIKEESKMSLEFEEDDKRELVWRIKELEEKLESTRKEKEREHIRAMDEMSEMKDKYESYQTKIQKINAKNVLDIENYKRNERKVFLNQERQRLGEYISQR